MAIDTRRVDFLRRSLAMSERTPIVRSPAGNREWSNLEREALIRQKREALDRVTGK